MAEMIEPVEVTVAGWLPAQRAVELRLEGGIPEWVAKYGAKLYLSSVPYSQQTVDALIAERDSFKAAHKEFSDRTEWVQETAKPHELGKHRADVLRERIERAEAEAAGLREALEVAREYVKAELACEKEKFAGYLHCSTVTSIESDLQQIDAALARKALTEVGCG